MKCPLPGFIVDVVEYPERKYLALRVYRDNVESFSDPQKITLATWLYQVRDAMRETGPRVFIEGVEHGPPDRASIRPSGIEVGRGS